MGRLLGHPWRDRLFALSVAALLVLLLRVVAPGIVTGIDERSGDLLWRLGAESARERRVVVVDIDEASLARIGAWPWPRERVAELVRRLGDSGAGVVALDILFPESRPGDAALAGALAGIPAVMAQTFALDGGADVAAGALQGGGAQDQCGRALPVASGYIGNAASLAAVAGHITPRFSADGAVRHLPAMICHEGKAYPALGLVALARAAGLSANDYQLEPGTGWRDPAWRLVHPGLPGIVVPLGAAGDLRIPYRLANQALVSVSAADIMEGRVPASLLHGAWVLVGSTALGLGDLVPTPHGGAVPGVEVHVDMMSGLLDARIPYTPRGVTVLQFALALGGGLLLLAVAAWGGSVGARRERPLLMPAWLLPLGGVLLGSTCFGLHAWLLLGRDLWIGWSLPAIFLMLAAVLLAALEHARTRFERQRLYRNLSAYLPEPVASRIAFDEVRGVIEAERREVTVLFADIRNFSAYCEGRPPEEAAGMLHAFFTMAVNIVEAHGGVVEEFVGDAIMAVWNAPHSCPDHAYCAWLAANCLLGESAALFPDEPPPGLEPLAIGVGIETGDALVGSFGPVNRRTHSALGETVTVAARLTAMTADLAQPLLLGEKAAQRLARADGESVGRVELVSLGEFLLDGLRRPRRIHAPAPARASTERPPHTLRLAAVNAD